MGEFILSGIDPLQIEILTNRIKEQVDIVIGKPILLSGNDVPCR